MGMYSVSSELDHDQSKHKYHGNTLKILKIRTPENIAVIILKLWIYHRVMFPNNADRMANSVDPDQTAPVGASVGAV